MAEALINGFLASHVLEPGGVWVTDLLSNRLHHLQGRYGIRGGTNNRDAVRWADTIILAIKPQIVYQVLDEIQSSCEGKLVISIAAGISLPRLLSRMPSTARLVRVMPNTPALVREGMSVLASGPGITSEDIHLCRALFESIGFVEFMEEQFMDAVTGISGSGPAYACLALEALADGGVKMGLPRAVANLLAGQTMEGAARLVSQSRKTFDELKGAQPSLSGVTASGIQQLEQGRLPVTLREAVQAAARKSEELGQL